MKSEQIVRSTRGIFATTLSAKHESEYTSKRARDMRRRFDNGMRETTSRAHVDDSGRDRR